MEQGRFGTHENLPALIENWSLKIGHWPLNSAFPAAQWPFINFQWPSRWRFRWRQDVGGGAQMAILRRIAQERCGPRRQHPAAVSRSQAPGKSLPRGLQNVKEQARERHTRCTLPLFRGNATFIFTFIFHLN
jgi:hypothetical protein